MNIRDLKYLVALSKYQHFGRAAEACFVSQPALSMQIKKLEADLGVKLLERSNKSVLLTPIGIAITEKAQHILEQADQIYALAKLAEDPYGGELKIGIIPTLAPYLLPLLMPALASQFPKLRFYLVEEQTALLIPKLKTGALDAAFLALPVVEPSLTHAVLFEEEFLLAAPAKHPLSAQKTVKQHDLDQQNVLLLEEGHCMRGQTLDICHKINVSEMQNFRATSLETLRHMVASGNGITLMPKLAQQTNDNIVYIPFSSPKPSRTIGLYWRVSSARKTLLGEVSTYIKKIIPGYF
ncbi:LysR substrate-binding domain-containing protein [Rickettsiella endosymbiont of Dermanyssus gallinae]|uniref:LysR substrate-binding domain-containing protein n=1 Tax=Rickettsiella endosymbiont of Dermanyssus gallinae TaxID=2856608 RepID=UPI001C52BD0A|nr:LysR substrate-binding domain-containing protein [Rickettsiella endosymbiont of Dermanyssus gallinae]